MGFWRRPWRRWSNAWRPWRWWWRQTPPLLNQSSFPPKEGVHKNKQTNKPIVLDCPKDQRSQDFKSRKPKPLLLKTNFKLPHPIQQCCHALSSRRLTQFNNVATPSLQVAPPNSTILPRPFFKLPHSIQQCCHTLSSKHPSLISTILPRPLLYEKA